ncbi:MAG: radical SAM protein [Candidatus Thermoplasmatota archaeon]|nr:radical SAM protein [Candidatus Thermoplasmatota archaeon]
MYDPIELSKIIEKLVTKDKLKKYYRFRPTGFYGGIATADTVGCNLRCEFCWSVNSVWNTKNTGEFFSPEQVARTLNTLAKKKNYRQVRVSGGEPTIGKDHLIKLLKNIDSSLLFILETNGILLGEDKKYIDQLSQFHNLHVRVCLKGCNPKEFSFLTGAKKGFNYQLKSLEYLKDKALNFNIAVVSLKNDKKELYEKLQEMGLGKIMIEDEEITLYPQVERRLKKEGLIDYFK